MLLGIPVLVEVVDAGDAASITVGVVYVFDIARPVSWVTRHHSLGSLPNGFVSQPPGAIRDQLIDQVEQKVDRLASALRPAHPGDLVSADAPPVDCRDGAGQPAVLQDSGGVHVLHLIQHGAPGQLPEESIHVVEAVFLQGRDDLLKSQTLQFRVRQMFNKRHFNDTGNLGNTKIKIMIKKNRPERQKSRRFKVFAAKSLISQREESPLHRQLRSLTVAVEFSPAEVQQSNKELTDHRKYL